MMSCALSAHCAVVTKWSPDRQWGMRGGDTASLELVDQLGTPIMDLIPASIARDAEHVNIAWSEDSQHCLILAQYRRGSVVYGIWCDSGTWHKAVQSDNDQAGIVRLAQQKLGGQLQRESRWFAGGMRGNGIQVRGTLTMNNGKTARYEYDLEFMPSLFVSDQLINGFEQGEISGRNYRLIL